MPPINSLILILAYVVGLMATVMPAQLGVLNLSSLGLLILGIIAAGVVPRYWRVGPRSRLWLTAGVIACLAGLYFNWRLPQPSTSDISQLLTLTENPSQIVTVQGRIQKTPRLTRSQRVQFWLKVQQAIALEDIPQVETETETETVQPANQDWRGKVYVTVPLLQGTGLHPGEWVSVTGRLYQPQASSNPGGFDFRAYLERQGSFAGLKGDRLEIIDVQTGLRFGWWQIRDRIIRTQTLAMGSPAGPLVSAMVLGNRVVDLPFRIRDQFARLGLAHTIAASGFHVSLILGVVLWLAKRRSPRVRFFTGLTALLLYIGLTGLQPSILRASIMGIGALVGMLLDRSTKPLGALLFAAVLLLIWNPLWIWDLGFQLSFLATFGLLTTAPAIVKRLDWLPPIIANLLAVPLAAMLWTLPLQLHVFGIFSPYSIIINILATPFIWALSLGGVLSSLAALIWQPLGLGLAWILQYPAQALIAGVATFNVLPGSSVALGNASVLQVAALYSLMGSVTLLRPGPWKWRAIALVMLGVILIPAWYRQSLLVQTTIFANTEPPTMLVQDQGTIGLINSGGETTARYVVLPFLRHQGINEIHWAVNTSNTSDNLQGWLRILEDTPIRRFYNGVDQAVADTPDTEGNVQARTGDFQQQWDRWAKTILQQDLSARDGTYKTADTQQAIALPQATLQLLDAASQLWEYQTSQAQWLWVLPATSTNRLAFDQVQNFQGLLWWDGSALPSEFLDSLELEGAIASAQKVDRNTFNQLADRDVATYWTGRDQALQWRAPDQIRPLVELDDTSPEDF